MRTRKMIIELYQIAFQNASNRSQNTKLSFQVLIRFLFEKSCLEFKKVQSIVDAMNKISRSFLNKT